MSSRNEQFRGVIGTKLCEQMKWRPTQWSISSWQMHLVLLPWVFVVVWASVVWRSNRPCRSGVTPGAFCSFKIHLALCKLCRLLSCLDANNHRELLHQVCLLSRRHVFQQYGRAFVTFIVFCATARWSMHGHKGICGEPISFCLWVVYCIRNGYFFHFTWMK